MKKIHSEIASFNIITAVSIFSTVLTVFVRFNRFSRIPRIPGFGPIWAGKKQNNRQNNRHKARNTGRRRQQNRREQHSFNKGCHYATISESLTGPCIDYPIVMKEINPIVRMGTLKYIQKWILFIFPFLLKGNLRKSYINYIQPGI